MISWLRRASAYVRRRNLDAELADEMQQHIALRRQALIDDGMDPRDAEYEARRRFGNVVVRREQSREAWRFLPIETVGQDVRYAARLLRRSPMFTIIAVMSLSIGIGATIAVFSLADAVLLRKLPVRNPDELTVLQWRGTGRMPAPSLTGNWTRGESSYFSTSFALPTFHALRAAAPQGVQIFGFAGFMSLNVAIDGVPEVLEGQAISSNFLDAIGLLPAAGRPLTDADDRAGAPPVALISEAFWRSRFASAPDAIGRTITVNAIPVTIVGVMPHGFRSTLQVDEAPVLTFPLSFRADLERAPSYRGPLEWWVLLMARIPATLDAAAVRAPLESTLRRSVAEGNPALAEGDLPGLELLPGSRGQHEARDGMREPLRIMALIAAIVLLVACAIVANLLTARGQVRGREIAVRVAIGAARARVIRQLLTEGLLLAAISGAIGLLFAKSIALGLLPALTSEPIDLDSSWRVLAFTIGIATFCTVLFGLAPALRTTDLRLAVSLQEQIRGTTMPWRHRIWSEGLVTLQVALSVLLLTGAVLLVRSVVNLRSVGPGFDPSNVLIFRVEPTRNGYTQAQALGVFADIRDRLAALPGVRSASIGSHAIVGAGGMTAAVSKPGDPPFVPGTPAARAFIASRQTSLLTVGDEFFSTMGIPVLSGRSFTPADRSGAPRVAIVNREFARRFYGDDNAVGRTFWTQRIPNPPVFEIVGMVADTKNASLRREIGPMVFFPYRQRSLESASFIVKTSSNPAGLTAAVRDVVRQVDPNLPVFALGTQEAMIEQSFKRERLMARFATILGAVTLLLTGLGLFGVLAYSVARRTQEIGLRIALGADAPTVRWMVMRQSMMLTAIGLLIGALGARWSTGILGALLFGLSPSDPLSLAGVAAAMTLAAGAAAYVPARRASRVDPAIALKAE